MPEVEYSMVIHAPLEVVWDFSKDPANWAHLLKGYQSHRVINERESVWTLKGDVGILVRTVDVRVTITEWLEKEKVVFALNGITESLEGQGTITVQPYDNDSSSSPVVSKPATMVSVRMALYAGGMMGPLINAAMSPLLDSVAKELVQKLTTTIEEFYSGQAGKASA